MQPDSTTPPSTTPLFPLGTVLFPGGRLPLQIFEVRYLDMVRKCHAANQPFGVVTLAQGSEVIRPGQAEESFQPIGTLAQITRLETLRPGLLFIECTGLQRFRHQNARRLPHGLWVAELEFIAEDNPVPVPEDLQKVAATLRKVLEQVAQQPDAPAPFDPVRTDDCGWLANRWCELLPLPAHTKHGLMALDNPLVRLELVADLLTQYRLLD
ncbi:LON peptidase substrate-binding domain-containing protein [Variovorax sp. HJSM1_2]|uniref:LON peptidase substrate-binding domain-containing protein n=1 Tax=Variovorax sp. HJSM1_2 TaxID=3366263 RepID=UPI003BCB1BEF